MCVVIALLGFVGVHGHVLLVFWCLWLWSLKLYIGMHGHALLSFIGVLGCCSPRLYWCF